jgi:hypothetical protein
MIWVQYRCIVTESTALCPATSIEDAGYVELLLLSLSLILLYSLGSHYSKRCVPTVLS